MIFTAAVGLKLHGSSITMWKRVLHDEAAPSALVFSTPKAVRTDEWLAWTPSVVSQALAPTPFPVENANIGAGKTPLLLSMPCRHYSMLFRPQLWGFFLFDLERGFAFWWNVKVLGLLLGFFFLLRALSGKFFAAVFGSCWLFLSAYTQWWFSCPPMLPEMLASWATAICCLLKLFEARTLSSALVLALTLVVAAVNYSLCFYPPFQIPLCYLALAVIGGWLWQNRERPLQWQRGGVLIAIAMLLSAAVVIACILECKPTLDILAQTEYPGLRRSHGGERSLKDTLNGVLGFFNWSERDYLRTRDNPSEASNFYPLWLLVVAISGAGLWRVRGRGRALEIAVVIVISVFTLYTFCPLPDVLCRWSLLSYVPGARALVAIGVGGILLTTLLMWRPAPQSSGGQRSFIGLIALAATVVLLFASRRGNEVYLTPARTALLIALNALIIGLYCFAPRKWFAGVFLLCLAMNNGGINPVVRGLGPLLAPTPAAAVRALVDEQPGAKWLVYSNVALAQFVKAQGATVLNGLQFVPDLQLYRELDPGSKYAAVYNRYGFFNLTLGRGDRSFSVLSPAVYRGDVLPTDPILLRHGARFAVFAEETTFARESGMRLRASLPGNAIWIYELPARSSE